MAYPAAGQGSLWTQAGADWSGLSASFILLGCRDSDVTGCCMVSLRVSQADNQIFRSIRLSLKLSPIASLWLLEDGLTRAFPGAFVSGRFTTCKVREGNAKKLVHERFTVDDDRSSTIITIGAESLFIARRRQLSVTVPFGVDKQLPVSMILRLPFPPQPRGAATALYHGGIACDSSTVGAASAHSVPLGSGAAETTSSRMDNTASRCRQ